MIKFPALHQIIRNNFSNWSPLKKKVHSARKSGGAPASFYFQKSDSSKPGDSYQILKENIRLSHSILFLKSYLNPQCFVNAHLLCREPLEKEVGDSSPPENFCNSETQIFQLVRVLLVSVKSTHLVP